MGRALCVCVLWEHGPWPWLPENLSLHFFFTKHIPSLYGCRHMLEGLCVCVQREAVRARGPGTQALRGEHAFIRTSPQD